MDATRLREDFEGLTPEEKVDFMFTVGPAFCRSVMADPAHRRQMMAHCLRGPCKPAAAVLERLRAVRGMIRATMSGIRSGLERLRRAPTP